VVVRLPAEIDIANSLDACLQLCVAIDGGAPVVIADMTRTRFCDSSGFRMLLVAADIAAERDAQFRVVVQPGSAVLRAIGVMAFDRVLNIYFRLQEALRDPGR